MTFVNAIKVNSVRKCHYNEAHKELLNYSFGKVILSLNLVSSYRQQRNGIRSDAYERHFILSLTNGPKHNSLQKALASL